MKNFNLSFKSVMYMKTRWILILTFLVLSIGQMWADVTIYVTGKIYSDAWNTTQSEVRINYNSSYGWSDGPQVMTKLAYTYNGYPIYKYTISTVSGIGVQFVHYKNGVRQGSDVYTTGTGDWYANGSDYNNKLFLGWNGSSHVWVNFCCDMTVYWANTSDVAGDVKAYAYGNGTNGSWAGQSMTDTGLEYNGHKIYSITFNNPPYPNVIFNANGDSHKTGDLTLGTDQIGKMYLGQKDGWAAFQYDVELDRQGGSTGSTSLLATPGASKPAITAPTRTGYDFGGYFTETSGGGTKYYNADGSAVSGNWPAVGSGPTTLYANWTAKTYSTANNIKESDGSTNAGTYTATYDATSITYNTTPSKTGYNLEGLYKETSLTNKIVNNDRTLVSSSAYTASGTSKWNQTSAPTLYVKWQAKTYSISLSRNGSGSADGTATATYDGALSSISAPTYSGFHVEGYYEEAELTHKIANGDGSLCTGTAYTDGSGHWTQDGAVTLYAKWEADASYYTLNYGVHASGHGSLAATNTSTKASIANGSSVAANTGVTMTAEPASYYEVEGWYNSSDCNVALGGWDTTNPKVFTLDNNYTVYVKFKLIDYTITYNLDGGSNHVSNPATYTYETAAITLGEPTKDGYNFGGWWTTSTFEKSTNVTSIPDHSSGNKTLYAKWTATSNLITYNDANSVATVTSNPTDATTGSTVDFTVTLKPGFKDLVVTATDAGSNSVTVTHLSSNTYRFTMPTRAVTVTISATALPVVYVMKTQSPTSAWTGFESAGAASDIKIWAWATNEDDTYNFYDQLWGSRYAANSAKATVITDAVGNEWYRFIPDQNLEHFGGSKTYEVIITSGSTNIYNTGSTHYVDAIQYNNTTNTDRTGSVWIVPHGTSENSAYLYTYPDPGTTAYSVTYNAGEGGSINVFGTEIAANGSQSISTPNVARTITAANDAGYTFAGWTVTGGASVADASSATTTVTASAAGTVTATWTNNTIYFVNTGRWTDVKMYGWLAGNPNTYGAWPGTAMTDAGIDVTISGRTYDIYKMERVPADIQIIFNNGEDGENKRQTSSYPTSSIFGQYFMAGSCYDDTSEKTGTFYASTSAVETAGITCYLDHMVTFGVVGSTGGTIAGRNTTTSSDVSSGTIVGLTDAISLTATPEEGYAIEGWYSDAEGSSNINHNKTPYSKTFTSSDRDITVYVRFEALHTVTLSAENGTIQVEGEDATSVDVASNTTATITAVPAAGYYFNGWTIPDGVTNGSGSAVSTSANPITIKTSADGKTVTANFVELDKIYFRNVFDDERGSVTHWNDVWVYLGITWNGDNRAVTNASNDSWRIHMTQIAGTDVWWAYVPRDFTTSDDHNIGFASSNDNHGGCSYVFYNCKAATRGDYSSLLNMFVPANTAKTTNNNSVDYFDNGYWMKYDTKASQGAGYYLKLYNSRNNYTQKGEFIATSDDATFISFDLRIDASNSTLNYMITSAGGLNYVAESSVTSSNFTDISLNEDTRSLSSNDVKFSLTTASEGIYTFVIDQSGDTMKLSVIYPVAVGDYRLKHEYNDGSAKTSYSDLIKAADAAAGKTVSMYLNMDAATKSLKLEKCTGISAAGKPVWGSNTTVDASLFNATTFAHGKRVYQFDITVATDAVSAIEHAGLYTGSYYIKTDCAEGGWANYKLNVLNENTVNFSPSDASTFDYYYCRYIKGGGMNVKFVIANDYNNAVSDTIVEDVDYLVTAGGGSSKEFLPASANIRFSYNSSTNTPKRAFINGSVTDEYLNIVPNAASQVYSAETGGTDYYEAAASTRKFVDDGNWVYEYEAWVVPDGQAGVTAKYNNHTQTLVPTTTTLMGKNGDVADTKRYKIRTVYDFKTNLLMTAWVPSGDVTDPLTDVEFMYIRKGQGDANQITFSGSGALSSVNKVYGVFQFDYNDYVGRVAAWPKSGSEEDGYTNKMCMFYFSFPFEVKVSDIFGIGTYGTEWIIQYYDGQDRADRGFFLGDGTTTFWKTMPLSGTLEANVGYSLLLDNDYFNSASSEVWKLKRAGSSVYLYFPSSGPVSSIAAGSATITVPAHECGIDREFVGAGGGTVNHLYTDSHWNMMGVPLFNNQTDDFSSTFQASVAYPDFGYLYAWNYSDNSLSVVLATDYTFKAMYAYMVQYAGDVTFSGSSIPASVAARRTDAQKDYTVELQVRNGDDELLNRAYVELRDEASDDFALNEDVYMVHNSRSAEVYTFAGNYDVAANVLSVGNHTIPVGVNVRTAGTYTFRMPGNFSGEVRLVDTYTGARTSLMMNDYEVSLPKGTFTDRFLLELNLRQMPTAIDGQEGGSLRDGKAHKFVRDGQMFILQNGDLYDARGNRVR